MKISSAFYREGVLSGQSFVRNGTAGGLAGVNEGCHGMYWLTNFFTTSVYSCR